MARQGQRLLLALASQADEGEEYQSGLGLGGILAALGGVLCVVFILLMCVCRDGDHKDGTEDIELQKSKKKGNKKSMVQTVQESSDTKPKVDAEAVAVNGSTGQTSNTFPGHSRQASSGSAHMRPTSLRELPEPPVSSGHHTRNKSLSGIEVTGTSVKSGTASAAVAAGGNDYAYPQVVHHPRNTSNATTGGPNSKEKVKSHSDGYDHLGPKPTVKPTDYDRLGEPETADVETPLSETSGGLDGHYSLLRERTYAVVVDVKAKAKELFDPYSKVKDKDDASSDYYSQVKEEDPYNHIGDSGGNISTSFIRRLRQSHDFDDTYSTVQDESGGDLKSVLESRGAARVTLPHMTASASGRIPNTPSSQPDDADVEDEYAVVQKAKGLAEHAVEKDGRSYSDHDISPYNVGPPEPPRLYNDYDNSDDAFVSAAPAPAKHKREHKYSKVTARESLASMSARNALNPYEIVADLPENTYATVEGGSGDGVILRGGAVGGSIEKRLSQTSDTYAEIGISGEGLSSSIISSSSSTGGNNNNNNSGGGSVAPVPPSLDSLHLMTKSQTSSEGDRLSDRHLASPEDSGMSLNIWGDIADGEDSEDGYSTLKKPEGCPQNSSLPAIPGSSFVTDEDSGEVTLVPNYQTVKDCISDNETVEEVESDPNYESVDEARAKVALLKARNASSLDSRIFSSKTGASNHVTVVKVLNMSSGLGSVDSAGNKDELPKSRPRRRRLDHDYEEVDLSPPPSPVTPLASVNHTSTSSYQITSISSSNSITMSSQTVTEARLDISEVRERVIQSHMYEELTEVRAKKSEMSKAKKGTGQVKNISEDRKKTGSNDKKKSEEKHKSSTEDKRKHVSEDKRKSGEDKKKAGNDEKRKTGTEDKDKKKSDSVVVNGTKI